MTLKDVNTLELVSSLKDYIQWNELRADNPFFRVRAEKGRQILAIVENEPNNQGYHDDMVEAIYNIYKECMNEVNGCKRVKPGLSFSDAFYYIYHVLVNEKRIENKINNTVPSIISIYKTMPEKAMKIILDEIETIKEIREVGQEYQRKLNDCKDLLLFLMKLI